jgi:hypothetical protein
MTLDLSKFKAASKSLAPGTVGDFLARFSDDAPLPRPNIAVIGDSGSGKTSSIRGLPGNKTVLIDLECKGYPFDASHLIYRKQCYSAAEVDNIIAAAESHPDPLYIVIDSFSKYMEYLIDACRATSTGFDIYTQFNKGLFHFFKKIKSNKHTFIVLGIPEVLRLTTSDGSAKFQRRIFTVGKEWEGKIEKEFAFSLFTHVRLAKDGTNEYVFQTQADEINLAKSIPGVFDRFIPNDLGFVMSRVELWYEKQVKAQEKAKQARELEKQAKTETAVETK